MATEEDNAKFAIHAAAREGRHTVVESLLNIRMAVCPSTGPPHPIALTLLCCYRSSLVSIPILSGWSPLMIAVSVKDSEKSVEFLLQRAADVNQKNHNGQTALHFVASKNNLDLAHLLLDNRSPAASVRVRDKRGQYALHRAAAVGSVPMINLLLKHKSPLNASDSAGYTALHHAVAEGHGHAAVALLKAGADLDKRDVDGFLALDLAPDKEVHKYVLREAENEGIDISTSGRQ